MSDETNGRQSRPVEATVGPDIAHERELFERCFPHQKGLWNAELNHGHGGYVGGINDAYWMGWVTRATAQMNGLEAKPNAKIKPKP